MTTNIRTILSRGLAGLALLSFLGLPFSCSDDGDWHKGPGVKDGCQQVRFAQENEAEAVLQANDSSDRSVTLELRRSITEGTLTVPLRLESASEGVNAPASVTFADGSDRAEVTLTLPAEAQEGDSYHYALRLTGPETDPYTDQDGSIRFEGQALFPTVRKARMWMSRAQDVLGQWGVDVLDLGSNKLLIKNLMGSGTDLKMTLDDEGQITLSSPQWESYNTYEVEGAPGTYYYYFDRWDYDNGAYIYDRFYPHGENSRTTIDYLELYSGNWYSAYDSETDEYYLSVSEADLSGESAPRTWTYLNFKFLAEGETFDDSEPAPQEEGDEVTFTASFDQEGALFGGSFDVKATKVGDNSYTFKNFLSSGQDLNFQVDRTTGDLYISGGYGYYSGDYYYFTTADNQWQSVWPNWQEGVQENWCNSFYFYTSGGYSCWNEEGQYIQLYTYFKLNDDYNAENEKGDYFYLQLKQ